MIFEILFVILSNVSFGFFIFSGNVSIINSFAFGSEIFFASKLFIKTYVNSVKSSFDNIDNDDIGCLFNKLFFTSKSFLLVDISSKLFPSFILLFCFFLHHKRINIYLLNIE